MNAYVKPFELADLLALGFEDNADNRSKLQGPAFTLIVDDKVLACGGITEDPSRPGVARVWTANVPHACQSAQVMRHIHASCKYFLFKLREQYDRVECDCLPLDPNERWVKRMGFSFECYSPKYYLGKTYGRWAWTS